MRVRIGIVINEKNDCGSCDFRIGFGIGGYFDENVFCENVVWYGGGNGDRII